MSDDPTQAAESAETAQSAVEPNAPAPWGDDFNPERAWQTISHLRGREKELESDAKAWKRLQEDEDALREFLSERGFTFDEEDDDEASYDVTPNDDPIRAELDELKAWKAEQEAQAGLAAFNRDVDSFAKEAGVEISDLDRDYILTQTLKTGNDPKAAKKAFDQVVEHLKAQEKAAIERYRKSKTEGVPSPPQPGKAGQVDRNPRDRNARRARMAAILAGNDE